MRLGYPDRKAERLILDGHRDGEPVDKLTPVLSGDEVAALQQRAAGGRRGQPGGLPAGHRRGDPHARGHSTRHGSTRARRGCCGPARRWPSWKAATTSFSTTSSG
ncbi:MAG: hypothetical protein U0797_15555 [Gemmataceae bacterium]